MIQRMMYVTTEYLCGRCHRSFSLTQLRFGGWLAQPLYCVFCGKSLKITDEEMIAEGYVRE